MKMLGKVGKEEQRDSHAVISTCINLVNLKGDLHILYILQKSSMNSNY